MTRTPIPGHISSLRAAEQEQKRTDTLKDASKKHIDPFTGNFFYYFLKSICKSNFLLSFSNEWKSTSKTNQKIFFCFFGHNKMTVKKFVELILWTLYFAKANNQKKFVKMEQNWPISYPLCVLLITFESLLCYEFDHRNYASSAPPFCELWLLSSRMATFLCDFFKLYGMIIFHKDNINNFEWCDSKKKIYCGKEFYDGEKISCRFYIV